MRLVKKNIRNFDIHCTCLTKKESNFQTSKSWQSFLTSATKKLKEACKIV